MATKSTSRASGRSSKKSSSKRELINTGTDTQAKTVSKAGQGDRGDRKR